MLNKWIAVYIPGTINGNQELSTIERDKIVKDILHKFSLSFGGSTAINGIGSWISGNLDVIETITIVKSYHEKESSIAWNIACNIAKELKVTLNQESVTIESNEGIDFI